MQQTVAMLYLYPFSTHCSEQENGENSSSQCEHLQLSTRGLSSRQQAPPLQSAGELMSLRTTLNQGPMAVGRKNTWLPHFLVLLVGLWGMFYTVFLFPGGDLKWVVPSGELLDDAAFIDFIPLPVLSSPPLQMLPEVTSQMTFILRLFSGEPNLRPQM